MIAHEKSQPVFSPGDCRFFNIAYTTTCFGDRLRVKNHHNLYRRRIKPGYRKTVTYMRASSESSIQGNDAQAPA